MLYEILLDAVDKGITVEFKKVGKTLCVRCYHPENGLEDRHELKLKSSCFEEGVVSRRIIYSVDHMV